MNFQKVRFVAVAYNFRLYRKTGFVKLFYHKVCFIIFLIITDSGESTIQPPGITEPDTGWAVRKPDINARA